MALHGNKGLRTRRKGTGLKIKLTPSKSALRTKLNGNKFLKTKKTKTEKNKLDFMNLFKRRIRKRNKKLT